MKYGNNSREFASRIEEIWKEIMKEYLYFSKKSIWIQAKNSSHFIHLTESELLFEGVGWINNHE